MKNIENGLRQIKEQSDNVLSAIRVFGYAVEFLNQMSEVSDERELRVIGGNIVDVKRDNISYNISLPVRRAIFLQVLKNPYSAGFPAYFPFLSCRSKARIFAGTFQS